MIDVDLMAEDAAELLRANPDLSRFVVEVADGPTTPEAVLADSPASAKKGRITIIPETEAPEDLGVFSGGTATLRVGVLRVVVVDRRNATLNRTAKDAVIQTLHGVEIASANAAAEFAEDYRRVADQGADTVRAWECAFRVYADDIRDTLGYGTPDTGEAGAFGLEDGSGAILLEDGSGFIMQEAA